MKTLLLALLLIPTLASAQAKPKHFYARKAWWVGEVITLAAVAVDYSASAHDISRGIPEGNRLLGPFPSRNKMIGFGVLWAGVWTGIHAGSYEFMKNDPNATLRTLSLMSTPMEAGAIHGYGAARAFHVCSVSAVCR